MSEYENNKLSTDGMARNNAKISLGAKVTFMLTVLAILILAFFLFAGISILSEEVETDAQASGSVGAEVGGAIGSVGAAVGGAIGKGIGFALIYVLGIVFIGVTTLISLISFAVTAKRYTKKSYVFTLIPLGILILAVVFYIIYPNIVL